MTTTTPITKVVFRIDKTGVLALFPELPADIYGAYCESYQLIGGHSAAQYDGAIGNSKPATEAEYRATKRWLETHYGYRLKVLRHAGYNAHDKRYAAATAYRQAKLTIVKEG